MVKKLPLQQCSQPVAVVLGPENRPTSSLCWAVARSLPCQAHFSACGVMYELNPLGHSLAVPMVYLCVFPDQAVPFQTISKCRKPLCLRKEEIYLFFPVEILTCSQSLSAPHSSLLPARVLYSSCLQKGASQEMPQPGTAWC